MNLPRFTSSTATEDLENFVEELQKVFECLHGAFLSLLAKRGKGWEDEEAPGAYDEEEERAGIPEGSEARVGEDASAGNESTLTSGEVSVRAALLLSTSCHVNSTSICLISVEEDGVTSTFLVVSQGTPTRRHNSVTRTGNGRDVNFCLALMAIFYDINNPRSIRLLAMIEPRQAALG
uniref:Uncharacterized protein n=1 Tax=Solanum tuberosum TaxID=4113 RepID=M1DSH4_SOLTU